MNLVSSLALEWQLLGLCKQGKSIKIKLTYTSKGQMNAPWTNEFKEWNNN